jgi:predicted nucleic-acid-binding Zn-ribbon protein
MVMPPTGYILYCPKCRWKQYQRTLGCTPTKGEVERWEKRTYQGSSCPKCNHSELEIKPASASLTGAIKNWWWDLKS